MKNFLWQNRIVVVLSAAMLVIAVFSEQVGPALQYQRQAIVEGQLHRLLTGHLVHTNIYHTLLNLAGLVLIWGLACSYISPREWWLVMFLSALMVSAGLVVFNPEVQWYRGFSGILHAILVVAILRARQLPGLVRGVILFILVLKIILEQNQSGLWQSEQLIGAPVIVDAHLYGIAGGFVSYLVLRWFKSVKMFGN